MKIRSLLLGSAAVMVAVSGAQAADAIVVEPEPVEYVRICDAYGTGFFYIPGTETCISFGGYVRSSLEVTDVDVNGVGQEFNFWGQRARLNIDVRSETDWGTLRAQYRLEGGDSNDDADIDMDRALISLAGFRFGFTDNYWTTNHGYAGINATGLGASGYTPAIDDGWYGFDDATIIDYTFAADNFSITIGAETPRIEYPFFGAAPYTGGNFEGGAADDASFYAGINYSDSWGGFAFTYVNDTDGVSELGVVSGGSDAYKVSVDLNLGEWIPGGLLHGMYMWDDGGVNRYVHNYGGQLNPDDIWQIAFQMNLSDEVQLVTQYSDSEADENLAAAGGQSDGHSWSVGLNWFPAAAPQFSVRASYTSGEFTNTAGAVAGAQVDFDSFFIGVRRDF